MGNSAKSETGFSLMNLVMGIVMVVIGYQNLPAETTGTLVEDGGEEDAGDPCPNGAAYWLYVVFGAWATWTDDYAKFNANPDEMNYCRYQPMVFAFSILLVKWILIPVMIAITCCCVCCGAMCCACFKPANTETAYTS